MNKTMVCRLCGAEWGGDENECPQCGKVQTEGWHGD